MSRRHRPCGVHPYSAAQVLALGPHSWWKAEDIALSDGAAVGSWSDASGNTHTLTQGTALKKPTYKTAGINGLPAILGSATNVTAMATGVLTAMPGPITRFIVGRSPTVTPTATQYLAGASSSGARRDLFITTAFKLGLQGSAGLSGTVTAPAGTPFISCAIFDGATSILFHDSIPTSGNTGSSSPTVITIGARDGQVSSFDGWIGEVIVFNSRLTSAQIMGIQRYLSRKWSIPLTQPGVMFTDGTNGSDTTNTGRSAASPLKTATKANSILGTADGRIEVTGEVRDQLLITSANGQRLLRLTDCTWYASEKHTSGWASVGGGVYSKTISGYDTSLTHCRVVSDLDTDGFWTTLLMTANTQSAPGEGECGMVGTTIYVHLAGGADPNTKTIEAAKNAYGIFSSSATDTVIVGLGAGAVSLPFALRNPRSMSQIIGANRGNVNAGSAGTDGRIIANNVMTLYGAENFATQNDATYMILTDCVGVRAANDSFGVHGTTGRAVVMTLLRCEGAFDYDEGASPHNDTILNDTDGYYHDNRTGGGVTGVQNAVMNLLRTVCNNNRTASTASSSQGGISYDSATMSGTCADCVVQNNNGCGFYSGSDHTHVTVTNLTSSGNALADTLPA